MRELWIAGGSNAALEVRAVAEALAAIGSEPWELTGFSVLNGEIAIDPDGLRVLDESRFLSEVLPDRALVVVAIGETLDRERVVDRYASRGYAFATLVHPRAVIGPRCTIGHGSVLMANAVLETHVALGAHALVNVGATIAHNGVVGDCCSIGPGVHIAGSVQLGDRCDLGVGCSVKPRIRLGPDTRVGAGAAVVHDAAGSVTLVGVPAKPVLGVLP